jgi:GNAT superfamily N-acetyltransferase
MQGKVLPDFLAGLLATDNKSKFSGITSIKDIKDGVKVVLKSNVYGSSNMVEQVVLVKGDSLFLDKLALAEADQSTGVAKHYMQGLYTLASDLGLKKMQLTANMELGGYAWAKYGFRPNLAQWDALKKDVWLALQGNVTVTLLPDEVKLALTAIMQSNDPAMIYLLADIGYKLENGITLGQQALATHLWEGELDLGDSEAVTRFLTYIGDKK